MYGNYPQAGAYFSAEGELLSLRLAEDQRYRLQLTLDDIAPQMINATLLYEDRDFYSHIGVDFSAVGRAFWQGVVKGGRRQGASTLTMQLARLRFDLNTRSFSGKLRQLGFALYLEWYYPKDEILQAYFNYAPYGGNIEGVGAASLIYFGKEASRLTLSEALALSVIPQNPNQRSPLTATGQAELEQARQRLAKLWQQFYPTTALQAARLSMPLQFGVRRDLAYQAPHFINQLRSQGLNQGRFYTSLSSDIQQRFEQQLASYLIRLQAKGINNASALLIKRSSMQVLAWLGSADFYNTAIAGQVDGVTALRSPGSALKPFIYALAIQQGLIHPLSVLKDLPRRFGSFNPENFDRQFAGPLDATQALIKSRNLPAVQLQAQLAAPDFYHWLKAAGVGLPQPAEFYGLALALGGMEISMQQLVQLYAMLGNQGQWQTLQWQAMPEQAVPEQAVQVQNAALLQLAAEPQTERSGQRTAASEQSLLTPEAAFLTLDMLRQHARPQAALLQQLTEQTPVAWKTGTSYAFRDAWAIGLSGDYVLAVWLGNFNGEGNPNLIGQTAAGPLLFELLALLERQPAQEQQLFTPASQLNLKQLAFCSRSGDLPNKYCPQTRQGWFIPGVSPIRLSELHRPVPVNIESGLRECEHQPGKTELKVFEFWPSDIAAAYQQGGVVLAQPPAFASACDGQVAQLLQAPKIRNPQPALHYVLGNTPSERQIALQASFDGAVTQAHWFLDNRYLGAVAPGETLFWPGEAGQFQLKVVDNLGGTDQISLHIVSALP